MSELSEQAIAKKKASKTQEKTKKKDKSKKKKKKKTAALSASVTKALTQYFEDLGQETPSNLYDFVLKEVEAPMLKVVMEHTSNNQSQTAEILGLNRGTLRKKLKQYDLI